MDSGDGLLIPGDTTLEGTYANEIEHVTWHWSGKHGDVVKGINLLTLLWRSSSEEDSEEASPEKSSREAHVPCDFRPCEKEGKTKNEHFREMLDRASERGFEPEKVVFDGWFQQLVQRTRQPQEGPRFRLDLLHSAGEKSEDGS